MIRFAGWAAAVGLALGMAGAGCESSAVQSPPVVGQGAVASGTVATDEEGLSTELNAQHRHHHTGFAGILVMAVETIGVTPEQQAAIDKIKADFHAKTQPVRDANGSVIQVLADGIAGGAIDTTKVDAAIAAVAAASGAVHPATVDVLNQLHAVLRPEQRAALVDKVEAHWSMWKEANAGDLATDNSRPDGHIAHLASEIGLSSDQVEKVRATLTASAGTKPGPFDPTEAEAHMKAFATAFAADAFDATALSSGASAGARVSSWGATRMAHFYEALNPVLTADQRAKVADRLRQHASKV
jgi:Spy/CpxP family protein refolding chaperone